MEPYSPLSFSHSISRRKTMPLTETASTAAASLRPQSGEYAPYYDRYISLVHSVVHAAAPPDAPADEAKGDGIIAVFEEQRRQTLLLLSGLNEADGDLRY